MIYKYTLTGTPLRDAYPCTCRDSRQAAGYLKTHAFQPDSLWRESVYALFLNGNNDIIGHLLVSTGGTDSSIIDVKVIAKGAVDCLASGVILSHNHPSGNPSPSAADIKNTDKLRQALALLDISLTDHIIVTDGPRCFSFAEESVFSV